MIYTHNSCFSCSWFHGYLSADNAKILLQDRPEGSFLFRFSGNPSCYSLSVSHSGEVTHWRISTRKTTDFDPPLFSIDDVAYPSLKDLVIYHQKFPLIASYLIHSGDEKVYLTKEVGKGF
jgi:hypothetical protein